MKKKFIYESPSTRRVISVLKSFTPDRSELTASEIYKGNGLSKATALRILSTLTQEGLLDYDLITRRYKIGMEVYFLGSIYLKTANVLEVAKPVIETLSVITNEAVLLSMLHRGVLTIIMKEDSTHHLRMVADIGSVFPAYATAMVKALLSELSETELDSVYPGDELLPLTRKTITSKTELKRALEQIRESGIAFDRGESIDGTESIASLIRGTGGEAIAAVAISVLTIRMDEATRQRFVSLIKMGCSLISRRLGYQDESVAVDNIEQIASWWKKAEANTDLSERTKIVRN